ncbi:hypothetical protein SAMN06298212_11067 [Ruaniaceae bacterium KH17]|nr:hypothetical protein SAMN06298212_11067 [Ruaniaceae bacterium KH17]
MTIQPGEYGEQVEVPPRSGVAAAIGPKWQYTAARFLGIAGGACVFLAIPQLSTSLFTFGAIGILLGSALSLWRVLAYLPHGTAMWDRARALWQNPWVLTPERRYFALPVVILALVAFVTRQGAALWLLSVSAVAAGTAAVYLGSPHLFLERLVVRVRNTDVTPRASRAPFHPSDMWRLTDLPSPPVGFPTLPRGKVLAVVRNVRTRSYAVLIDGVAERPAEWSRWSHTDSRWETPLGTALVEAHEIWDGRPEAIVTITLPDMMIVIEGVAGRDTALANARLLTRCLTPREAAPAVTPERPGLFDRTLGYPLIPMFVGVVSAALTTTVVAGGSSGIGFSTSNLVALIGVSAFGPPLIYLTLNLLGVAWPHVYRLDRRAIRSRAQVAFWVMLLPSLWSTLVMYFAFEGTFLARVIQWVPTLTCAAAFVAMLMIRSPEKNRQG